jgi:hypothetical protein
MTNENNDLALKFFVINLINTEMPQSHYIIKHEDIQHVYNIAKIVQRHQIIEAYLQGAKDILNDEMPIAINYYNKTYNK